MSTKNTDPDTLKRIAEALGLHPDELEIVIEDQEEHDDQDGDDTEPDHVEAAERRLAESHPHLTQSERRRYAEQETPGIADFIAMQKEQTPPAHRNNPDVRAILKQRQVDREVERRKAFEPMPNLYGEDGKPSRSNISGEYLERQDDLRRQHEEHKQEALAKQQEHLDEIAARLDRQAEASQAVEDEITALRKRRRREEAESAKNKPKHGHI